MKLPLAVKPLCGATNQQDYWASGTSEFAEPSMNADPNYEHTQIGWVILLALLLPAPMLVLASRMAGSPMLVWVGFPMVLLLVATFGTLTVRVDRAAVSLRFGIGLVRRRFPLAEIRSFAEVENPWYFGWGIHFYRGGTLYNVSGGSAVELVVKGGRRVRIGSDESAKFYLALRHFLGKVPASSASIDQRIGRLPRLYLRWGLVMCALCVGLGLPILLHFQARPPAVSITVNAITVDNMFYGQTYPLSGVSKVELLQSLPEVRLRTNGYSAGGTLRGWFTLVGLGSGKLFVEVEHAPFVAIYLPNSFVILNYSDSEETRRLYAAICAALAHRK